MKYFSDDLTLSPEQKELKECKEELKELKETLRLQIAMYAFSMENDIDSVIADNKKDCCDGGKKCCSLDRLKEKAGGQPSREDMNSIIYTIFCCQMSKPRDVDRNGFANAGKKEIFNEILEKLFKGGYDLSRELKCK